jgi:hypothetical protein
MPGLGPTYPRNQWVSGVVSLLINHPDTPPPSAEVEKAPPPPPPAPFHQEQLCLHLLYYTNIYPCIFTIRSLYSIFIYTTGVASLYFRYCQNFLGYVTDHVHTHLAHSTGVRSAVSQIREIAPRIKIHHSDQSMERRIKIILQLL